MSLHHIAKHLKEQGRGSDDMLVHMTSGEFKAMQQLAKAHGTSLTVNPKTGLPEAGVLSTVLPMALGAAAAASGQWWAIPAAVALSAGGTYAMTGSLQQGLMAGLGAWSGGSLATGLAEAGAGALATEGGELAAEEFAKSQAQSLVAAGGDQINQTAARELAQSQIGNMSKLTADQVANMTGQGLTNANAAEVVRAAGATNAAMGSGAANNMLQGATSLSGWGSAISNNVPAALGAGTALVSSASGNLFNRNTANVPGVTNQSNPFGMKEIPRDADGKPIFYASVPEQPNPAYKPVYRDYVKNPYTSAAEGGVMKMADGGLPYIQQSPNQPATANGYTPAGGGSAYGLNQTLPQTNNQTMAGLPMPGMSAPYDQGGMPPPPQQFADGGMAAYKGGTDWGSLVSGQRDVEAGLNMASRRPLMDTPTPDVGIYTPEAAVRDMDPLSSTMYYLNKVSAPLPKGMKGLSKPGTLGAVTHSTAAEQAREAAAAQKAKEAIAKESDSKDAKEGGLMRYAEGGDAKESHIYKPAYTDYKATPYNLQQAMQSYNAQPQAGLPQTMPAVGSQGYAIDPLLMRGSPAYIANEAKIAAEKAEAERIAQLAAASAAPASYDYGGGGAGGGLMPDALQYARGGQTPGYSGHLGGYSDGGRLLKGPGDGVSDSIPATIGGKQPARLAEGEFVIPARIVSELGNGSTDAGAKRLYAMMDRIKAKRAKTKNIAANTKAYKYLPA